MVNSSTLGPASISDIFKHNNSSFHVSNQLEYVEVISDSKEVISVILLAVKSPIINWKSYCKGDVGYYEIHRADGSHKTYIYFSDMLNDLDREDLIVLYRLFNEKYASTRPGFDNLMLWGDMKIMFKTNGDDAVWKNHHGQESIEWKLYDSCGVYSLMLGEVSIHMLVEKKYPLPQDTHIRMLKWKLHVNYNVTEMAYELLRFISSQLYIYFFIPSVESAVHGPTKVSVRRVMPLLNKGLFLNTILGPPETFWSVLQHLGLHQ
ncbi:hypothetical protein Tco_1034622 [Tanacetum coccineum]